MSVLPARESPVAAMAGLEFHELFREHAPYLWRALRGLGVRSADVDDAWQEVLLVVHRRLPEFDGRALRAWLYAICIRVASDYRRSARVRREVQVASIPEAPLATGLLETIESKELWERLLSALEGLDADKRTAFVLYEIEELSLREVAEATGVPLQTIYSRLNTARAHVKARFAQSGAAPRGDE
jgi:RNA polymerase sigma-70 factor (ECF subfamily)